MTTAEASKLTGLSRRVLQYWDEAGIVSPARKDGNRIYSKTDVITILVLSELRKKGIGPVSIHALRAKVGAYLNKTEIAPYLLTDGREVWERWTPSSVTYTIAKLPSRFVLVHVEELIALVTLK